MPPSCKDGFVHYNSPRSNKATPNKFPVSPSWEWLPHAGMAVIITRNTHAQSMPRAEESPEICKQISVVATCSVLVRGAGDEI